MGLAGDGTDGVDLAAIVDGVGEVVEAENLLERVGSLGNEGKMIQGKMGNEAP